MQTAPSTGGSTFCGAPADEHRRAVVGERDERGIELCVAAVERRRARRHQHAAPVRVAAEERRLDERRGRDALCDRLRLVVARGAADRDLGEQRRALAVGDDLRATARRRRRGARRRTPRRSRACARSRAAPEESSTTASFVEHSPSTVIALKLTATRRPQELDRLARLERVVGRDDGEHRGEVGVDHPRALRHAADREPAPVRDGGLRVRVGGEDRLGGVRAAVAPRARRRPRRARRGSGPSAAARRSRRSRARSPAPARGRAATAACSAVAIASAMPCAPVAAFATPELTTIACGCASSRCCFETTTGAASTRFCVHIAAPVAGASERTSARSRFSLPDPRVHARGDESLRRGDAQTSTPVQSQPGGLVEPEREVRVLHGLSGGALAEVVERADDDRRAGRAVGEDADLGGVGALHARQLGRDALGQDAHDRARRVGVLEQRARVGVGLHVTRREQAAAHGQQVGDEADRHPELLGDLRRVAVRADGVRREVLEHRAGVRRRLQRLAGARDARLRVDTAPVIDPASGTSASSAAVA